MSDKGRFDLEKSRFKQRFPNLPQEQFQYLLKKEKPELYKTAVREGWLKPAKEPVKPPQPKVENNGKKDTGMAKTGNNAKKDTGIERGVPQEGKFKRFATPEDYKADSKPSTGKFKRFATDMDMTFDTFKNGKPQSVLTPKHPAPADYAENVNTKYNKVPTTGSNPTADEINKLYAGREKTINPNDILGKGAKATEGAAKATSKEGLLSRVAQLGQKGTQIGQKIISNPVVQKGAQVGQKIINSPIVNNPVTRFGGAVVRYGVPILATGNAVYTGGVTLGNWNKPGSDAVTRGMDMLGYFHPEARTQAQIRRESNAPYGSYTSNSVNQPTEAEQAKLVAKYNAGQPQANMSEEDVLKMNLYGTTNVTGDSVPVDNEGILDTYTGSTGGAVGGDGAGTPPSQGLTEIGDSGNANNNNGGVVGGIPVDGSAAQAATYQPSGILPASPEYYADEAYLANLPFSPSGYTQQSLDNLNNGYVKQADIYERLNRAQQAYNDAVTAQTDPRYQGGIIPATGYNVNPVLLQDAQSVDRVAQLYNTMYGENNQIGATQNVLDNAQTNYEVGIANQAGVPYKNYEDAMLKRREQEITARAQDVKNQLEFQKQQTDDLKERRELAQKQYEVDVERDRELIKARLDHRAKMEELGIGYKQAVDVAMINGLYGNQQANIEGRYGLGREQLQAQSNREVALINNEAKRLIEATKQGDSTAYINAISNLGTMLSGMSPQMVEAFLYGNPTIREAMFGKGVTPEQAMIMLGRYQNSDNQGTGFWNWLRGNK